MTSKQTDVRPGPPAVRRNISLRSYNTLQVEATAARFVVVRRPEDLVRLFTQNLLDGEVWVLGAGSNVLFQGRVEPLVLKVEISYQNILEESRKHVLLQAGAGVNWHELVSCCVGKGWGGIENLALIPGTAGAAPIQNIGAYGVELKDRFHSLSAFDLQKGAMQTFNREQCRFGYRDSIFKREYKNRYVITSITLRLDKPPHTVNREYRSLNRWLDSRGIQDPTINDIYKGVVDIRTNKLPDPSDLANAGSFFKNPLVGPAYLDRLRKRYADVPFYPVDEDHVKIPAGWLIEKTGWKGKRTGNVGTYENQALVIVNHGGATGVEIRDLARKIGESVRRKFGIELVPEVNIVGSPPQ